jgi:hypothetical protein
VVVATVVDRTASLLPVITLRVARVRDLLIHDFWLTCGIQHQAFLGPVLKPSMYTPSVSPVAMSIAIMENPEKTQHFLPPGSVGNPEVIGKSGDNALVSQEERERCVGCMESIGHRRDVRPVERILENASNCRLWI